MLEEILKSTNSNLERIANAQEEFNILYKKFTKSEIYVDGERITAGEKITAGADVGTNLDNSFVTKLATIEHEYETTPIPQITASKVATPQTVNISQTPTDIIIQNPPVQQPATQQAIPTAPTQNTFTREQLAVAMSNAVAAGKMNIIQGILQQLGVQALTQVNPTEYNKVAAMLKEAGVEV